MSYKIEELNLKDNSNSEQTRTRKIFLDLKSKAIKGEKLTEHEKEFFCQSVRLSLLDDGLESDYPCCSNPIFKFKYLIYWHDLTGGTAYQKPERGKLVNISQVEAERDLKYLIQEAKNWLVEIEKTNHTLELMQQISKETRCQKKTLDNTPFLLQGRYPLHMQFSCHNPYNHNSNRQFRGSGNEFCSYFSIPNVKFQPVSMLPTALPAFWA